MVIPMDATQKTVEATAKIVQVLLDLDSDQRSRAVSAALVLLGEPNPERKVHKDSKSHYVPEDNSGELPPKAASWAARHSLELDQLHQVFSIDAEGVEVIAARAPGKSKRMQTIESYVLCGLRSFLANGDPSFADEDARAICKKLGAYDSPNHYNYVKGLGNLVSGGKDLGWKLSNPGLARAAEIVRDLAPAQAAKEN